MNIKPIPAELLDSGFTLIVPTENGEEELSITRVRIQPCGSISNPGGQTPRDGSELTIWYDCELSLPRNCAFQAGQKVRFCGREYELVEAKLFRAFAPHHYRLKAKAMLV